MSDNPSLSLIPSDRLGRGDLRVISFNGGFENPGGSGEPDERRRSCESIPYPSKFSRERSANYL